MTFFCYDCIFFCAPEVFLLSSISSFRTTFCFFLEMNTVLFTLTCLLRGRSQSLSSLSYSVWLHLSRSFHSHIAFQAGSFWCSLNLNPSILFHAFDISLSKSLNIYPPRSSCLLIHISIYLLFTWQRHQISFKGCKIKTYCNSVNFMMIRLIYIYIISWYFCKKKRIIITVIKM